MWGFKTIHPCLVTRQHNFTILRPGVQISSIGDWEIPSDALIPWQQWVELCGLERIAKHLLPTVSRLRGNESGFSKKYQQLWDDVRGAYLTRLQSQFPLSTVPEQIHKLEAMYNQLETAFYRSQENPGEMARLSNAMLKVLSAIHVLTGR